MSTPLLGVVLMLLGVVLVAGGGLAWVRTSRPTRALVARSRSVWCKVIHIRGTMTPRIGLASGTSRRFCAVMLAVAFGSTPFEVVAQTSIESTAGFKTTGKKPGPKGGAGVNGTAGGYAEVTPLGLPVVVGGGQTQYTSGNPPTVLTTNNALAFPTPTAGNKTGVGDVRPKVATPSSSMVAISSVVSTADPKVIFAIGRGEWLSSAAGTSLVATASIAKLPAGWAAYAAGYANDPYEVAAGTYAFAPVLDGSFLLRTDGAPDSEAAQLYTQDTPGLTTPGGTTLTTPHLWSLLVKLGPSQFPTVDFQGDPLLMSVLGITNQHMNAFILGALDTSVSNQVVLKSQYTSTGLTLFDTTLTSTTDFFFGESVGASAAAVPEPSPLVLLAIACAAGIGLRRPWKKGPGTEIAPNPELGRTGEALAAGPRC